VIIRNEQMEELGKAVARAFEGEMVTHLAEFSPPLFNAIKEEQLREAIRFGISRAGEYGITFRGPVRFYLELMLLFGSHFDRDPQYPWATEILKDQNSAPQMQRAERIYEKTLDYRKNVTGPQEVYTLKALRSISMLDRQPLPVSAANFGPSMLKELARIYPQKAAYVGADRLEVLVNKGIAAALSYGFSTVRAIALPVVLMFGFGHNCFADPLYPWIAKTLDNSAIADPDDRAKRLEETAVTWLDQVLAYFDEGASA
jgi:hypothetical protein